MHKGAYSVVCDVVKSGVDEESNGGVLTHLVGEDAAIHVLWCRNRVQRRDASERTHENVRGACPRVGDATPQWVQR
jgi:hypothetical protein